MFLKIWIPFGDYHRPQGIQNSFVKYLSKHLGTNTFLATKSNFKYFLNVRTYLYLKPNSNFKILILFCV